MNARTMHSTKVRISSLIYSFLASPTSVLFRVGINTWCIARNVFALAVLWFSGAHKLRRSYQNSPANKHEKSQMDWRVFAD